MDRVGFIGLGNMGAAIAANIQKAGFAISVYDVRADLAQPLLANGARSANSPFEVTQASDVIFTSLPGPAEVEQVVRGADGILKATIPGKVYIDLSTNSPLLIRSLAEDFTAKGAHMLDAPVSGGKAGAISGNLAVMVGGDRQVFERIEPLLKAFGDKVFYAGAIGSGTVCKLVHNVIAQNFRQIVAEGLTLGVKAGVSAEILWEAVRRGAVGRARFIHETLVTTILRGKFEPASFSLGLAKKDLDLALELAHDLKVPLPLTELVHDNFVAGMERGWMEKDSNIVFLFQEEAAGVEVRAPSIDAGKAKAFITTHLQE